MLKVEKLSVMYVHFMGWAASEKIDKLELHVVLVIDKKIKFARQLLEQTSLNIKSKSGQ